MVAAQDLSPPGKLRLEHGNLIQSLQLRVSGVNGLAKAFAKTIGSKSKTETEAVELSQQAYRLLASDIIWDDLFQTPSEQVLEDEGVHGVKVPSSHFLLAPDLIVSQHAMAQILQRIGSGGGGGGTPVGLHGTNIVSTAALPNGAGGTSEVLSEGTLNTVTTSSSLVFEVTIHNGGDSQEVQIPVTLTIARPQQQGGPITKTEKVQLIDPGTDRPSRSPTSGRCRSRRRPPCRSTWRRCRARPTPPTTRPPTRSSSRFRRRHSCSYRGMPPQPLPSSASRSARRASSLAWMAWTRVRRLRDAQRTLVGGGRKDLVEFAVSLQGRIDDLHRAVDEVAAGLARVDRRVDDDGREHRDRPLRRLRGHGRPPVGFARPARRGPHGGRDHGDPGARLRPDLHEGDRPRAACDRPVAGGAAGRRARHGQVTRPKLSGTVQQVLVLNASFEPLNVCSLRRAHVLVHKGKAEVVEELDRPLCSATARFPWPHVIRLCPTCVFRASSNGRSRAARSSRVTAGAASTAAPRAAA